MGGLTFRDHPSFYHPDPCGRHTDPVTCCGHPSFYRPDPCGHPVDDPLSHFAGGLCGHPDLCGRPVTGSGAGGHPPCGRRSCVPPVSYLPASYPGGCVHPPHVPAFSPGAYALPLRALHFCPAHSPVSSPPFFHSPGAVPPSFHYFSFPVAFSLPS